MSAREVGAALGLDLRTVRPFARQLVPLAGAVGVIAVVAGRPQAVVLAGAVFAALGASYPFAIGERDGLDTLRAVLPVGRGTLVAGRYAFTLVLYLAAALVAVPLAVLGAEMRDVVVQTSPGDVATSVAVGFGVYALLAGTQLPVYYALGYTRGRMVAIVPLVLLCSAAGAAVSVLGDRLPDLDAWLARSTDRLAPLALVTGAAVLAASAAVSWRADRRRWERAGGPGGRGRGGAGGAR
ncbi:ABC-2 transporter permease [Cellulomonas sp. ES6]|uniref:ABC-2 transporter permease n=1 Tax=Cellulomonas sp. ES6 TaxID=3039384 RepID=UPI0024B666E9|nr:ABC-2 transporter permease [Cellulomonas sp. ES6]WHP17658.1 ABC-2 transporter permease [Cellulomonas sp. ES6]